MHHSKASISIIVKRETIKGEKEALLHVCLENSYPSFKNMPRHHLLFLKSYLLLAFI